MKFYFQAKPKQKLPEKGGKTVKTKGLFFERMALYLPALFFSDFE